MANVTKLPNGKYQADYVDGAGRRHRPQFRLKKDAEACVNEKGVQARSGLAFDESAARQTFETYAMHWWRSHPSTPNYDFNVRSHLKNHILPVLGKLPIGTINRAHIHQVITTSNPRLNATSMRTMMTTTRMILRAAVADRVIPVDPTLGWRLPKIPKKQVDVLELEHVEAITDMILERYRALVTFDSQSGLRQGEIFGLRVHDIDWNDPAVTVRRQIQSYTGAPRTVEETKTRTDRVVSLIPETLDLLRNHMSKYPPSEEGYIFTNTLGRPLHRRVFDRAWVNARTRAAKKLREELQEKYADDPVQLAMEMPNVTAIENAKFHGLRHFYASVMIEGGCDAKQVSELLGHANPAMTLQVYAHLFKGHGERTREALRNKFLRNS